MIFVGKKKTKHVYCTWFFSYIYIVNVKVIHVEKCTVKKRYIFDVNAYMVKVRLCKTNQVWMARLKFSFESIIFKLIFCRFNRTKNTLYLFLLYFWKYILFYITVNFITQNLKKLHSLNVIYWIYVFQCTLSTTVLDFFDIIRFFSSYLF